MISLINRLQDEADQCRNDGANDIAALLDEAVSALRHEPLLEALRDCVACLSAIQLSPHHRFDVLEAARAAIAKAEGA